ncbi:glycosyltransferase [Curtobacterium sp. MCBA15_004]|uniref:rhamnosyltransferase WsaF family glycosyltransferase n=1 Tax=unclassified Curtobacterium TaxID=257496 RepID=UPI0008DC5CCE|nr:glycosyltransferase [Curtobacterium sp. MCBA15_004]WIA95648.1 glycosyltransferase [Curtobacterium sp. MCBA15_004]
MLHNFRVWAVESARKSLPMNSRGRGIAIASYHSYKGARSWVADTRQLFAKVPQRSAGFESYHDFLAQQRRIPHAPLERMSETRFAVVVESTDPKADQETRESVQGQRGDADVQVVVVPRGTTFERILEQTDADFYMFLRGGSVLRSNAFTDIARLHRIDPALRLIVLDSDHIGKRGRRTSPRFRPMWSPEMLLGANYVGRAFAASRATVAQVPEADLSDRGVWRFLLSADLEERTVGNVSRVLLSERVDETAWRALPADAAMVREVLESQGHTVSTRPQDGVVRVSFEPQAWPKVSIVIPTRHNRGNLDRLLPSLARTDYPEFDVTVVDNGGETEERAAWYAAGEHGIVPKVIWWTETPFNYSRVNNVGVRSTDGDVVVMLNDDTEIVDPTWLRDMVGMLERDGVATVGMQHRQGDGLIQHGGVMVGPNGFADNLFTGMRPGSETLLGSTRWYRDSLAVTGACVAISREHFEAVNGLDERFILTGSDVVLGLDQIIAGRRNVVIPFDMVRHYESITRGTSVPMEDFYASYWRYHPWLQNGDPYSSPNVSRLSAVPRFASTRDPKPVQLAFAVLGRAYTKVAQSSSISDEAKSLLGVASITHGTVERVHELHARTTGPRAVRTINWFIPDVDMPFFGGLNTAFRLADKLTREHGVHHRFIAYAQPNEAYIKSAIAAAFPSLAESEVMFYDGSDEQIAAVPEADAAIATLWLTAMHVARSDSAPRKFYLMQDYEPAFYPASSMFAMAEESYRLGLYGICNTESMHRIYSGEYGGKSIPFTPAVDRSIYHPDGRREKGEDEPVTIFAYARDHFRNCWELVFQALTEIKRRHGDGVRIVAAGARYLPQSADFIDMGLLDYRATGRVYRETDIGLTMQISRHPSYLPLELMASGVPMVAPDSEWFTWLFRDDENSQLTMRSLDDMVENLDTLIRDAQLRRKLSAGALRTIDEHHSSWDHALEHIYPFLVDPEGVLAEQAPAQAPAGTLAAAEAEAEAGAAAQAAPAAPAADAASTAASSTD